MAVAYLIVVIFEDLDFRTFQMPCVEFVVLQSFHLGMR